MGILHVKVYSDLCKNEYTMGLLSKFFSNTRKPEGFLGKIMVNGMNGGGHAALANWAMDALQMPQDGAILDIGCGGGANVARLLKRCPHAKVYGVDYSSVSVAKSHKVNANAIKAGRCEIKEASVSALPLKDGTFNLVTAFETIYFWPDIEHSFAEVRRVMAPSATFCIVNEDDGLSGNNEKWEKMIEGMHTYTPDEIKVHLTAAGFHDIIIRPGENRHWLMVTAIK